jgi:hypothetical protein
VEKVHLEWQQLCCTYNTAGGKIVVLHDVWGQAAPGEMQVRHNVGTYVLMMNWCTLEVV